MSLKGILLLPLIVKSVGATTYGGFVLTLSVLGIAVGLSSVGIGVTARRFLPSAGAIGRRELFYPQFYFNLAAVLACSALLYAFQQPLRVYLLDGAMFSFGIVPLYLVLYMFYSQGTDYLRYTGRVRYMTVAVATFPYLHIGFILFGVLNRWPMNIDLLVGSMALAAAVVAAPCLYLIVKEIGIRPVFYGRTEFRADARLGLPLFLVFFVDIVLSGGDRYAISYYLSVTDVGYYVPAYVLGSLVVLIPKAMGTALPQLLAQSVDDGDEERAKTMLNYAVKLFVLLAIPFVFGCLALGQPILRLLANEEIAARSSYVAPLIAISTFFSGFALILMHAMFVRLQTRDMFVTNLVGAAVSLVGNWVLLYFFRHIVVAALVNVASCVAAFIYAYHVVRKQDLSIAYVPVLWRAAAASSIMYGFLWSVAGASAPGPLMIGAQVALGAVVYLPTLVALRTFSGREIAFLRTTIAAYCRPVLNVRGAL